MAVNIMAYFRIRLMTADQIAELFKLYHQGKDGMEYLGQFVDVQTKPFDDDVPTMTAEELRDCLACLTITEV